MSPNEGGLQAIDSISDIVVFDVTARSDGGHGIPRLRIGVDYGHIGFRKVEKLGPALRERCICGVLGRPAACECTRASAGRLGDSLQRRFGLG
jgi:hypothetical protein